MKAAIFVLLIPLVSATLPPVFRFLQPECSFNGNNASCCTYIMFNNKVCSVLEVDEENSKAFMVLVVDGISQSRKEIRNTRMGNNLCIGSSPFQLCLSIYGVNISFSELNIQVCSKLSVKAMMFSNELDFGCIRFKNGKFELGSVTEKTTSSS